VWAKRLEEGTYAMPFGDAADKRREITSAELGAILSGIDLSVIDHLKSSFSELCRYSEARRHHPRRRRKSSVNHQHGH
jgi:hypothetical protein